MSLAASIILCAALFYGAAFAGALILHRIGFFNK
jgi:hypothetical protein